MTDFIDLAELAALVAVAAGLWSLVRDSRALRRERELQSILATFGPAIQEARHDPRALLAWYPLAEASRHLFPEAFTSLDGALSTRFPFSKEQVEAAHARWTADWLAWERAHDLEYKLKASEAERELEADGQLGTSIGKARLETIEREQLERYQARYQEYVTVAKALAALGSADTGTQGA